MARSRGSQRSKQAQPESKKALIIFLVFFILTTIGGGLFGYYGYTVDETKDGKIKTAESKAKKAEDEAEFYKYQALLYRRMLGQEKAAAKGELDGMNKAFIDADGQKGFTTHPDRNDVLGVIDAMKKRLATVSPQAATYEDALKIYAREIAKATDDIKPQLAAAKKAEDAAAASAAELTAAKTSYGDSLKNLSLKLTQDQVKDVADREALKAQNADLAAKLEEETRKVAAAVKQGKTDVNAQTRKMNDLNRDVGDLKEELSRLKNTSNNRDVPVDLVLKPVGKVVDRKSDTIFINMGQVQRMSPQMSFSVHAVGADGQPFANSKGSLEVTTVFESGSQAKILFEKSKTDQIQAGDVLVNPNWNPDRKKHIAIAGIVDLTGDGRNQIREFLQVLARQNIVVDSYLEQVGTAWVEVKTGKGISRDTSFLVDANLLPDKTAKDDPNGADSFRKLYTAMKAEAHANGVIPLNLTNYLDMIGYPVPQRGSTEAPDYRTGPMGEKKDPMPAPEKKDPPKPAPEKKDPPPPAPEKKDPAPPAPEKKDPEN